MIVRPVATNETPEERRERQRSMKPGAPDAVGLGCTCSTEHNNEGDGVKDRALEGYPALKVTWYVQEGCPLHLVLHGSNFLLDPVRIKRAGLPAQRGRRALTVS